MHISSKLYPDNQTGTKKKTGTEHARVNTYKESWVIKWKKKKFTLGNSYINPGILNEFYL